MASTFLSLNSSIIILILKAKGQVPPWRCWRSSGGYSPCCRCSWIMSIYAQTRAPRERRFPRVWLGGRWARWITRRGNLTACAGLCDHSKLLIISLTFLISAIMKENRQLHPRLCSPRLMTPPKPEPPLKKKQLWIGFDSVIYFDTNSVTKQT